MYACGKRIQDINPYINYDFLLVDPDDIFFYDF